MAYLWILEPINMKYLIARFVFFVTGWKLVATKEDIQAAQNSVMIAAPHTSNYDLVYAVGTFWLMRLPLKFFIKDFYTRWYFFGFFKWMGAIGVNRSKRNQLVEHAAQLLQSDKNITLMVPAEGTRKRVDKWKTGFYQIAKKAGTPISLGYLDYEKKHAGILKVIPCREEFITFSEIEQTYKDVQGKYPELYNTKIF